VSNAHVGMVVEIVRKARPRAIAIPFGADRHPDHAAAHRLLTTGVFRSGLRRYASTLTPWRPEWVCAYFINDSVSPSFVVDVSDVYETKKLALACHRTQFEPAGEDAVATRLTSPLFLQLVESRDAQFGASAGVRFAEGFVAVELQVRALLVDRWPSAPRKSDAEAG
jgi:LmbE family N-acetylglucosaminyl deacetylase